MKRIVLFVAVLFVFSETAWPCVGKVLTIGALKGPEGEVISNVVSVLITERTGTTVNTVFFDTPTELYTAVKEKTVGMLIENTKGAMKVLGKTVGGSPDASYAEAKKEYRNKFNLIWMEPFGYLSGGSYTAVVLREDILMNFPALPRVINKLGNNISDGMYDDLVSSVIKGVKPKKVARDFLKSKKLI